MKASKKSGVVDFTRTKSTKEKTFRKSELPKRRPMSRRLRSLCLHDPHVSVKEMVWPEEYQSVGSVQRATKEERLYHAKRADSAIPFGQKKDRDQEPKKKKRRRSLKTVTTGTEDTADVNMDVEMNEGTTKHTAVIRKPTWKDIFHSETLATFPAEIRKYMASEGFVDATPVQRACWKAMLDGKNSRVVSQPGTGKTLAFLLPIAHRLKHLSSETNAGARALVFVPTRELAEQIFTVSEKLRKLFQLKTASACGGTPIAEQIQAIHNGADIIVGTPGRMVELLYDKHIHLNDLKVVILDEADKMLSGNLGRQLEGLKEFVLSPSGTESRPQVCVFSATLPEEMDRVLQEWIGSDAISLSFSTDAHLVSPTITQIVHVCAEHKKLTKLRKYLAKIKEQHRQERSQPRILIFANTIKKVRSIHAELHQSGCRTAMLHGKRTQQERSEAMRGFRAGRIQILVATDVAGRGLDVKNLPHVVNFDFPSNLETYIHRIGRTGRLATDGHTFSFFTRNLAPMAKDLIALLQHHHQHIDLNLQTLQESYKEAAQFMEKMEEIEQQDRDTTDVTIENDLSSESALLDSLSDVLRSKKRRRKDTEGIPQTVIAKKRD